MNNYITDIAHIDELRTQLDAAVRQLEYFYTQLYNVLTEEGFTDEQINDIRNRIMPPVPTPPSS